MEVSAQYSEENLYNVCSNLEGFLSFVFGSALTNESCMLIQMNFTKCTLDRMKYVVAMWK
jgi:hypothetical protein